MVFTVNLVKFLLFPIIAYVNRKKHDEEQVHIRRNSPVVYRSVIQNISRLNFQRNQGLSTYTTIICYGINPHHMTNTYICFRTTDTKCNFF